MKNPAEAADQAWIDHISNPKVKEALKHLGSHPGEVWIAFEALWKLSWIRKQWKNDGQN